MEAPTHRDKDEETSKTPSKPAGILLTPGTSTSRRKRVSFGHDVLDRGNKKAGKGSNPDEEAITSKKNQTTHKRTKLIEALENSRRQNSKSHVPVAKSSKTDGNEGGSDDDWEEDGEDFCTHDITLDLNEPHSRSGKYWKSNFEQYHQDAKAEMEKLLKYKQLAKSYAKMKDAEAIDLHEKLKEEQGRVIKMEKKITEMASQIATKRVKGDDADTPELMKNLAKQTALAVQYRTQVEELESLLQGQKNESDTNTSTKVHRRRQGASPRTQKTLLETQRELRRARAQVREIGELRDEVDRLKSELLFSQQRASKLAEENKKLTGDPSHDDSRVLDLKMQLRELQEESRQKDDELVRLKEEYLAYSDEAEARQDEASRVLEKATNKISELKKEIKDLKAAQTDSERRTRRNREAATGEAELEIHSDQEMQPNVANGARERQHSAGRQSVDLADLEAMRTSRDKQAAKSRTLRDKYQEDIPSSSLQMQILPPSNVLADRPNLERPKWQPYHPRSPRNRDYFTQDLSKRIFSSSAVPSGAKAVDLGKVDLPVLNKSKHHLSGNRSVGKDDQIDLLPGHPQ
jgi:hypothetical protein